MTSKPKAASATNRFPSPPESPQQCDKTLAPVIRGLSLLIAHARHNQMTNVVRILSVAKEDLVYWAVNLNFHETAKEQFINQQLHGMPRDMGSELLHCIQSIENGKERGHLLQEFDRLMAQATELSIKDSGVVDVAHVKR